MRQRGAAATCRAKFSRCSVAAVRNNPAACLRDSIAAWLLLDLRIPLMLG
jgi:hypothetical protein